MMSIPFFLFFIGLGAAWFERRPIALGLWSSGMIFTLALFGIHATGSINITL